MSKTQKHSSEEETTLKILESIHEMLVKQNSLKSTFIMGVMRGLGTALGATVVIAIVTSVAIKISSSLNLDIILDALFGG